jgi:hypothetical protein
MKHSLIAAICVALSVLLLASSPGLAQEKTAKACRDEWRANKEANQAAKITEKDYVAKCRADAVTPAADPKPTAVPAKPITPAPAPTATAPKPAATPPATMARPAPTTAPSPVGQNQFAAEGEAKARCPSDTVVWANLGTKVYHFAGHKDYGNTKRGAYMCEKDTTAAGVRAAKNEKHP